MINLLFSNPILFVFQAIALIIAISVHEFAHAKTADYLGDPTPGLQGRLTLNPKAHLDMYGTLFLLLFGFGWGKPVEFDPYNLKNPRRDAAIISVAGPLSNFALALLSAILIRVILPFDENIIASLSILFLVSMITLNLLLGVLNLLPIHPFDGFKIVGGILPEEKAHDWYQLQRYGFIFFIMLIIPFNGKSMLDSVLDPILTPLYKLFLP